MYKVNTEARNLRAKKFIDQVTEIHNGLYDYSDVKYKNIDTKVSILCTKHGEQFNKEQFIEFASTKYPAEIAFELNVDKTTIHDYIGKYNCSNVIVRGSIVSIPEGLLYEKIVKKYKTTVIRNSRSIIPPKEIDIFLPQYNLAIEFNGVYWHRPDLYENKDAWFNYHQGKIDSCNDQGIALLHLWENYDDHDALIELAINGKITNNLSDIFGYLEDKYN